MGQGEKQIMFDYVIRIMPFLLEGLWTTAKVYVVTIIFAIPLAVLAAIGKVAGPKILKGVLAIYTWAWRGTPLLLQLFIVVFGLPVIGIRLPLFVAAVLVYVLNMAAYITEIMRAAIQSVDKGQYEAAKVLGMSYWQTMFRIILPQSIRMALPPTCSEAINLVKDTALLTTISMHDLLRAAKLIATRDYSIVAYIIAFMLYLIISSVFVKLFGELEKKAAYYD
jgi:polar amino acid transport system permease protein